MTNLTLKATSIFVSKLSNEGANSFVVRSDESDVWVDYSDKNGNAARALLGQATKTKSAYQLKKSYQSQVNKTLFIR